MPPRPCRPTEPSPVTDNVGRLRVQPVVGLQDAALNRIGRVAAKSPIILNATFWAAAAMTMPSEKNSVKTLPFCGTCPLL